MASIKERAAALNLDEKLRTRPHVRGLAVKAAQTPSLGSSLISHLRSSLKVRRLRVYLKSHNDCFLGSEAVDVVAEYISSNKAFEGATARREKVVNVCQALLDCNVLEAVGTKVFGKSKETEFQDSKSALYRFVHEHIPSVEALDKGVLVDNIQKLFSCSPSEREPEQLYPSGPKCLMPAPMEFSQTSTKVPQLESPVRARMPLENRVENLSLSPTRVQTHSVLPQSVVDEVWQEQTLLRLLNLVELPLLEGVLQIHQIASCSAPSQTMTHNNTDLIYSSNHLDRQILKAFRDSQHDEWLCASLDLLDFLPDQPVLKLSRELPLLFPQDKQSREQADGNTPGNKCLSQSGTAQCKMLLYGMLVRHYNTDRPPLLPERMTDVYSAITELLVDAKFGTALEALQLCLKLLPPSTREELYRILTFMTVAADTQEIKLDKEIVNRLAVKRSFSRAVLNSKSLPKEKEDLMVVFMLSNVKEIFKIPGALHKSVSDKLTGLVQGKQPDVTGCQVSSSTYIDTTKTTTNNELSSLLHIIHLDTKLSPKEKKRRFRQFFQAHPAIFNNYFGESAINML
ncbi:DEP domain-containing protein 7-like [Syngnathoides biaculeatus]|uniref:DEP domain-containing protein 7-like n=1 Tax=Syngnathoides biaculeatus TaxID=300417 RepID=UPI002ADDA000|nr:DEP domain-containing protein 7-like [Syngnathoides biaculeatus]